MYVTDNDLIATPFGRKKWGLVKRGLLLANVFDTSDLKLLRKQKAWVLGFEEHGGGSNEYATGLANLLDCIQDVLVAGGIPEEDVFGE